MFSAEYRETSGMKLVDALSEVGHQRCFIKKGVLKNSIKFTRKHLCQSLFLVKLQAAGLLPATLLSPTRTAEIVECACRYVDV